jgi:DMSO/TMAO reductase YedYZ molybdopterin-dependent catalytic subunit
MRFWEKEGTVKRYGIGIGALVGFLLAAPLIGLMYLTRQLAGLPFLPFELFDWITRVLPGDLVTFGIDLMIDSMLLLRINVADTAKQAEQVTAILLFLAGGTLFGALYFAWINARKGTPDALSGAIAGALFGLPLIGISIAIGQPTIHPILRVLWIAALFLLWGVLLSWIARRLMSAEPEVAGEERSVERISRRQFLITLGASSATITVVSAGVGSVLARNERQRRQAELDDSIAHLVEVGADSSFPNANDPVAPVPGTRPEYTPVMDHYKVFLRTEPTVIGGSDWTLPITGMVDNPLMLTLEDIRNNFPSRDQFVTLSCISGRIGTTLISTTMWTGVSLQDLLAEAQVQEGAQYLEITSGDGFHETADLNLINSDERIMLCYAWDGNQLPVDHGFPLRIWIPDRYGMKQPKWITGIEVIDEYREGYWVERNWDEVAQVKTTSVIDTVAVNAIVENDGQQLVPIGGIAFSGARGISNVELRVDGGPWEATLLRSPLSETTWVIWRYEWLFAEGEHTFEVRCTEADSTPQIEEVTEARPSGATGIHQEQVDL